MKFASLLVYTPNLRDPEGLGRLPRKVEGMIKGARPEALRLVARRCRERAHTVFRSIFGSDCTLVPVPPSSPPKAGDTLWPGLDIAKELVKEGLANDVANLLVRSQPVPRAHHQPAESRPKFDQLVDSLEWRGDLGADLQRIILVDDIVTRGTTFLSAREAIHRVHPWLEVVGFAAVRTMSFEVVTEPLAPTTGSITLAQSGWGNREP